MLKRLVYISLLFVVFGCSEYQKVLKSTDLDYKFKKAVEYYDDGKFNKAYPLFDELLSLYRGTHKAADVYYYFAYTNFKLKDYILAAYHFKNFSITFPSHEKAEEMSYMVGYCYYLESPTFSLAQDYTYKAINEIQLFVNTHPDSEKLPDCNKLIIELRRKLERKSFELALQYFKTQYYQSAVVAFSNTLNDYPDTKYREEILLFKFQASYELARNSIEDKKLQRFIETRTAYLDLVGSYPESAKLKDIERKYEDIVLQIKNLKTQS